MFGYSPPPRRRILYLPLFALALSVSRTVFSRHWLCVFTSTVLALCPASRVEDKEEEDPTLFVDTTGFETQRSYPLDEFGHNTVVQVGLRQKLTVVNLCRGSYGTKEIAWIDYGAYIPQQWWLLCDSVTSWLGHSVLDLFKLKRSGNSTAFLFPEKAYDRNCHLWIRLVHLQTKAVLLRNAMSLMPVQVQRSLLPQHANDISLGWNLWLSERHTDLYNAREYCRWFI